MRRLLVLRHGRTEWNAVGRFQGQADPDLDDTGRQQAALAARHLKNLGIQRVVTSDLKRAAFTADALAESVGLTAERDERLREVYLGAWQGLTRAEVQKRFPDGWKAWTSGADFSESASTPEDPAESYAQCAVRAKACAEDVVATLAEDGLAALVMHGGTARALIGSMLELPGEHWWRLAPLGNCCWSLLVQADNGWRLAEHGVGVQETAQPASSPDTDHEHGPQADNGDRGMAGF